MQVALWEDAGKQVMDMGTWSGAARLLHAYFCG